MPRLTKWLTAGLLLCLAVGLVGGTGHPLPAGTTAAAPTPMAETPAAVLNAIDEAQQAEEPFIEMDLVAASKEDLARLRTEVEQAGGEVLLEEESYVQVRIPPAAAAGLVEAVPTVAAGVNEVATTSLTELVPVNPSTESGQVAAKAQLNLDAIGARLFRQQTSATGAGIKIAIIDSGIDPSHPDLQKTPAGLPKIIDWKDFTQEGQVKLPNEVAWGATYTAPDGRTYRLPSRPASSRVARFGYWEELKVPGRINRDLDRNGSPVDKFGVLAVDSQQTGLYDVAYVDTNNDGNFADEKPLRLYRQSQTTVRMGPFRTGPAELNQLAIVLAGIDPAGTEVSFGFDSLGHGTQVAGVAAANGTSGMIGVAPGAQLLALKVITSRDEGSWFVIREAIQYAVEQGADVINVSLGGLPVAAAYDTTASTWLNEIADRYDVLIALAAGNTGPGLSSGATLGSPSNLLSVGAYYSPAMWQRDYGLVVPNEGVWWLSGMGPRSDGSLLPNLIAPGGSPTTSPQWLDRSGYTTASGTSIATPHVTGSAALLLELARRDGLASDFRSLRRAMEQGARQLLGVGSFEQGSGLLNLDSAYRELQRVSQVPALVGKNADGGDGLYIRAYRPGNDAFQLTNPGAAATRISVFSNESWVQPAFRTMTVPGKGTRELPLQMSPPTSPGVHSAFIQLLHASQVAPTVTLPVTYVQPVPLDAQKRYAVNQTLEVARYRRYFVQVASSTQALRVTTRVTAGAAGTAEGTVQVQVFRPDGQMLYRSDAIGTNGVGLTAAFSTPHPMEGVWEVVVTALPDADGSHLSATYALDVEAPEMGPDLPIRFVVEPGANVTVNVPVTYPGQPADVSVEAIGLAKVDQSAPWRIMTDLNQIDDFTLHGTTGLLLLVIENVMPATSDLDMLLYRYDVSTGWQRYWSAQTAQPGRERLQYANLPPGRYRVYVQHNGTPPTSIQYQYRRSAAPQAYQLSITEPARHRTTGQSWEVPMRIRAPESPGRYVGDVVLYNVETGESVAWYPIEISVGQPSLRVEPMVAQLQQNKAGRVVLEVRDGETGQLVDAAVTVNGQRYQTRKGQVSVPVYPTASVQSLAVTVDLPSYQYFSKEIKVPVSTGGAAVPAGGDAGEQEKESWRRKLEALLP